MERTEFGQPRSTCGCPACVEKCHYMPGMLIPADLERMAAPTLVVGGSLFVWAQQNLLASPGALVAKRSSGELFRVPTLVPATKPDGSCINLTADGRCAIHAVSPFGCAFFDCGPERAGISKDGLFAVIDALRAQPASLYRRLWDFLWATGKRQQAPELLRAKMKH